MIEKLKILELQTIEEWRLGGEVLQVLRPNLIINDFVNRKDILINDGFKFIALTCNDKYVSVASYTARVLLFRIGKVKCEIAV